MFSSPYYCDLSFLVTCLSYPRRQDCVLPRSPIAPVYKDRGSAVTGGCVQRGDRSRLPNSKNAAWDGERWPLWVSSPYVLFVPYCLPSVAMPLPYHPGCFEIMTLFNTIHREREAYASIMSYIVLELKEV